jgi:hypothetical protein
MAVPVEPWETRRATASAAMPAETTANHLIPGFFHEAETQRPRNDLNALRLFCCVMSPPLNVFLP